MPSRSRRALLAAVGLAVGGFSGCLDDAPAGDGSPTDQPSPTPTAAGSPSPSETPITPTEQERTDDFYVENYDGAEYVFSITLASGDDTPVDGRYRVPGGIALRWAAVGVEGETYDVSVSFESGPSVSATWAVEDCPNYYEGNRNAGVLVENGEARYVENECDAITVGHALPRANAEEYRV